MPDMGNEELYWDGESWDGGAHQDAVCGGDLRCPGVGEGIAGEGGGNRRTDFYAYRFHTRPDLLRGKFERGFGT